MTDEIRCPHLLQPSQCFVCKPPPAGVLEAGWRTSGGFAYHNSKACESLRRGQEKAHRRGTLVPPPTRVRWVDIDPVRLSPCRVCCTEDWLRANDSRQAA
jgi:hypothetical protein